MEEERAAGFERLATGRLELRAVGPGDLDGLFALTSDPGTWRHAPAERHTGPAQTRAWIGAAEAAWRADGLGYWTVRHRGGGEVIGVGGVQHFPGKGWNLYYRFTPSAWGRGYATELARAAVRAGNAVRPEAPVVAWILEHNHASRRVVERIGFTRCGERVDESTGALRLLYADRAPGRAR
ncbi:GNAT family N-acetyltransferase [Streptomyces glaucosporus]|uniref:GNAT family N-acetyltransferase n=1 Tax=Streptomyces glaucosporus TaxID=284044 RepID=A0ABP5UP85_9ACTN